MILSFHFSKKSSKILPWRTDNPEKFFKEILFLILDCASETEERQIRLTWAWYLSLVAIKVDIKNSQCNSCELEKADFFICSEIRHFKHNCFMYNLKLFAQNQTHSLRKYAILQHSFHYFSWFVIKRSVSNNAFFTSARGNFTPIYLLFFDSFCSANEEFYNTVFSTHDIWYCFLCHILQSMWF